MKFRISILSVVVISTITALFIYLYSSKTDEVRDIKDSLAYYEQKYQDTLDIYHSEIDSLNQVMASIRIEKREYFLQKIQKLQRQNDSLKDALIDMDEEVQAMENSELLQAYKEQTGEEEGIILREDSVFEVQPIQIRKGVQKMIRTEVYKNMLSIQEDINDTLIARVNVLDSANAIQAQIITVKDKEIDTRDGMIQECQDSIDKIEGVKRKKKFKIFGAGAGAGAAVVLLILLL